MPSTGIILLFCQISELTDAYDKLQRSVTDFVGYFIIVQSEDNIIVDHLKNIESYIQDKNKVSVMFDRLDIVGLLVFM